MAVEYCPPSPEMARRKNLRQMVGGKITAWDIHRDPTCFGTQIKFLVECDDGCKRWFGANEENIKTGRVTDGYAEED